MPKIEIPINGGNLLLSPSGKNLVSLTLSFGDIPNDLISNINQTKLIDLKDGDVRKIIFSGDFKKSHDLEIFFLSPS